MHERIWSGEGPGQVDIELVLDSEFGVRFGENWLGGSLPVACFRRRHCYDNYCINWNEIKGLKPELRVFSMEPALKIQALALLSLM